MTESAFQSLAQSMEFERSETRDHFYKQMLQSIPGAFYICDASGTITYYNDDAVHLWGREPIIGKDAWCGSWKIFSSNGHPLPIDSCPMAILLKDGILSNQEDIIIERPDGSRRHILPHPRAIKNSQGKTIGAFNMLVDITEGKKTLEWSRASEQFIQRIISSSNDGIILLDLQGNIQSINEGGISLLECENISKILDTSYIGLWDKIHQKEAHEAIELAKKGKPGKFSGRFITLKSHTLNADGRSSARDRKSSRSTARSIR